MNIKKLQKSRKRIDQIDKDIFKLIKKRTNVVRHMMKIKTRKNQIIDKKRINEILKEIKKKSIKNNIDPKITYKIWKSMIWSYIEFQKKNFKIKNRK